MGLLRCNSDGAIMCSKPNQVGCGVGSEQPTETITPEKLVRLRVFSFKELETATSGFSRQAFMGQGSHGSFYKGTLRDGKLVTVKRQEALGDETAFDNELEILSTIHSDRFVNLVGFSKDSKHHEKLLVVDFMPNGTLHDILHRCTEPLTWAMRAHLALQIAKSINALHSASPPVIHRDIKSANILIDGRWNAKLGGFGLALRGHFADVLKRPPPPAGTRGYFDPSYETPRSLSTKSDVFSFGVLLLELLSGRKAADTTYKPPHMVDWALPLVNQGKTHAVFDPKIPVLPQNSKALKNLLSIAARSVRRVAQERPSMAFITAGLEDVCRRVPLPEWIGLAGVMKGTPTMLGLESPANRKVTQNVLGSDGYGYNAKESRYNATSSRFRATREDDFPAAVEHTRDSYQDSGLGPDPDPGKFLRERLEYSQASSRDENQSPFKQKSSSSRAPSKGNSRDASFRTSGRESSRETSQDHLGEQQQVLSWPRHRSRGRSRERSRFSSREHSIEWARDQRPEKFSDNMLMRDVGEAGWHPMFGSRRNSKGDSGTTPTDRFPEKTATGGAAQIVPVASHRSATHRRNKSDGSSSFLPNDFLAAVSNHADVQGTEKLKKRSSSSRNSRSYLLKAEIRMLM